MNCRISLFIQSLTTHSIRSFFSRHPKELLIWVLVVTLTTLKIYQGDQSFFDHHFGDHFDDQPVLDWMKWLYHHLASLLLWALIPFFVIRFVFKEKLSAYGWTLGDWRFGLKATIIAFVVMIVPVYISSFNPEHREWYPLTSLATASAGYFALWGLSYLPHYIGWEFFFRGFIGVGLKPFYGSIGATGIQVIMTVLLHLNKPMGETWGAAIAGVYLGWLTYRTGSVWWAILFHFYLGMLNTWMCA
ncbi:MAG: CPBP family intramembrane glutamic endopeptidase [Salibacteraceae bacterium]